MFFVCNNKGNEIQHHKCKTSICTRVYKYMHSVLHGRCVIPICCTYPHMPTRGPSSSMKGSPSLYTHHSNALSYIPLCQLLMPPSPLPSSSPPSSPLPFSPLPPLSLSVLTSAAIFSLTVTPASRPVSSRGASPLFLFYGRSRKWGMSRICLCLLRRQSRLSRHFKKRKGRWEGAQNRGHIEKDKEKHVCLCVRTLYIHVSCICIHIWR